MDSELAATMAASCALGLLADDSSEGFVWIAMWATAATGLKLSGTLDELDIDADEAADPERLADLMGAGAEDNQGDDEDIVSGLGSVLRDDGKDFNSGPC